MGNNLLEELLNRCIRELPPAGHANRLGVALTMGGHLLLVILLLYTGGHIVPELPSEKFIQIDIIPTPALAEALPQFQPRIVRPVQPQVTPPIIEIAPEPQAITAQLAPRSLTMGDGASEQDKNAYVEQLRRHLLRFMHPPGAEGVATLRFFIDKSGIVTFAEIAMSSGNQVVDAEALALLARAQPLPPIPDKLKMTIFGGMMPVAYHLEQTGQRRSIASQR